MAITAGNITGSITIGLDGHDAHTVGTFEVPITTTFDAETGIATLQGASPAQMLAAMAKAMLDAAQQLLDQIPEGIVEVECATCGSRIAYNGPADLEHGDDGSHVFVPVEQIRD